MARVLVVSPHPDDESLGCGGTLHQHVVHGDVVRAVFLTSGEQGGHGREREETARLREREATTASGILGLAHIEFWRQPDGALRTSGVLVDRLRRTLREWRPRFLYVTHEHEQHPDHRAAARLVRRAITGGRFRMTPPTVRLFEVWTPLQRIAEVVDISSSIEVKLRAIRAHRTQCRVMRFDEAFLALSRYRGEMHSWPGGEYAEVFAGWSE